MFGHLELYPDSHAAGAEPDTRELPTELTAPEQRSPPTPPLPGEVRARPLNRPPPA